MIKLDKFYILVIDDDNKLGETIQLFFNMRCENVVCVMAQDIHQATFKMSNQAFDLILVDNILPGRSGIDYALTIRKSLKYGNIPLILMSGSFQQDDVVRAIDGGLRDIIVKPFSLDQLHKKILEVLKRTHNEEKFF